jgi:hypothetical protein
MTNGELTVGELRAAIAGQPDEAMMKFVLGDARLRVKDAWPNETRAEYVIEFEPPEGGYQP